MTTRRRIGVFALAGLICGVTPFAQAQPDFPSRTITFVVPFPAGGTADQFARSFGQALSKRLGQTVIIDNRPGANGNIGSSYVAKLQPADGYTLLFASISSLAINPHLYKAMGYDPIEDLQPVTLAHQMSNVLVVGAATPYQSVADVIAAAKAKPGDVSYGSAGNGNTMHLSGELFQLRGGVRMLHVPYKGGPPALNDVLAGQIPMMFNNLPAIVPLVRSGKLKALAVDDTQRSPLLPEVPTMAEAGLPGSTLAVWSGILIREGTPDNVLERLAKETRAVLESPEFREPLEAQGYKVLASTPDEFETVLRRDYEAMGALIKRANIQMQ